MENEFMDLGLVALLGSLLSEGSIAKVGTDPRADQGAIALIAELAKAGYLNLNEVSADIELSTPQLRGLLTKRGLRPKA